MNKILNRNLNKITKDTVYIVHKDWKDGSEKVVAEVYLDKNLSLSQKIDKAFMLTNSIEDAWWNNNDVHALYNACLLYTSPSPRDLSTSRMPSSA